MGPSVAPKQIEPVDSGSLYLYLLISGRAIVPKVRVEEITSPTTAAKAVLTAMVV